MNNLQRRKELEHKIELFAKAKTFAEASQYSSCIPEYMNLLSADISSAIGSINSVVAPFIIAQLETYADAIKSTYPGIKNSVDSLKKIESQIIKVAVPHE